MKTVKLAFVVGLAVLGVGPRSIAEPASRSLTRSVVRIVAEKPDGPHVGTGFFYGFSTGQTNASLPVIVTCWHVVSDSTNGFLYFRANKPAGGVLFDQEQVKDFSSRWVRHPDTNVDLAVLPCGSLLNAALARKAPIEHFALTKDIVLDDARLRGLGVFLDVKFLGYPIWLWDAKNYLPISRRGMTASDPAVDYEGRSEFLIDADVLPGSSGSPVLLVHDGSEIPGLVTSPNRVTFLGVIFAMYQHNLKVVPIPTAVGDQSRALAPASLGVVIKARRIEEFRPLLFPATKGSS